MPRGAGGQAAGVSEKELAPKAAVTATPLIPIHPPEVWGCGCTYESSASFRDAEHGTREGFYAHVYREHARKFSSKARRGCAWDRARQSASGRIHDSPRPEPELAVVLGSRGRILGYTLANDVSAWDIERQNPLYLTQSKIYQGACAFGPVFVTPDELGDIRALQITCRIDRGGRTLFSETVGINKLGRTIDTLIEYLLRCNPAPAGTLLLTGTGIIATQEAALAPGDIVDHFDSADRGTQ